MEAAASYGSIAPNNGSFNALGEEIEVKQQIKRWPVIKIILVSLFLGSCVLLISLAAPYRSDEISFPHETSFQQKEYSAKGTYATMNLTGTKSWLPYKYAIPGTHPSEWHEQVSYYLTTGTEESSLGCDGKKISGELGDFQLHYVYAPTLEDEEEKLKVSYWQNISEHIYGDMSTYHPLMNNKIQILVTPESFVAIDEDLRKHKTHTKYPNLSVLRKTSYYDDVLVAHLILNIEAALYELVSYVIDELNLDGYTEWTDKECSLAQRVNFNPRLVIQELESAGKFQLFSKGGFKTGYWTSVSVNTAATDITDLEQFTEIVSGMVGLSVSSSTNEYCDVYAVSEFDSTQYPALGPYRQVKYVYHKNYEESTTLIGQWEQAVGEAHQGLYRNVTKYWGSNWDHWLDRHIGIVFYPHGETATYAQGAREYYEMEEYFKVQANRPVGLRLWTAEATKFYVGYSSLLAWEYHLMDVDLLGWDQNLCTCVHANNDLVYLEEYGQPCYIK